MAVRTLLLGLLSAFIIMSAASCTSAPAPRPRRKPPRPRASQLPPLSPAEIQRNVTGAARLSRSCMDAGVAAGGLYVIRLFIEPSGQVSSAQPRSGPSRLAYPARYSGVPRYLDAGPTPDNPITRCYAAALRKLRFRPFGGPTVGFDHPVVVDPQPPSENTSRDRRCESDDDCAFRPQRACSCLPCGLIWRRAVNKKARRRLMKRKARAQRRCHQPKCRPCKAKKIVRGKRALCIREQCAVR